MNDRRRTTTASRSRGRVPTSQRCWSGRGRRGKRRMGLSTWGAGPLLSFFCCGVVRVDRPAVALTDVHACAPTHGLFVYTATRRRKRARRSSRWTTPSRGPGGRTRGRGRWVCLNFVCEVFVCHHVCVGIDKQARALKAIGPQSEDVLSNRAESSRAQARPASI